MSVRIAIAHDYLTQRGGAEKVVLSMARIFPDAPIYTLLYDPPNTYPEFASHDIRVSPLNRIRPLRRNHRSALPVLPFAASAMRIPADVVLTSSSGWAHGFRTSGVKLVFCHSPARWLYLPDMYLGEGGSRLRRGALSMLDERLRSWDQSAAQSCDRYLAVSSVIQRRIVEAYGIEADVVPPPVRTMTDIAEESVPEFDAWGSDQSEYYLCVSRLLPYKNVEQVVQAFAGTNRRLVVVGRGPEAERISAIKTANVLMLKDLTDGQMATLYRKCRAVIAASFEDFGLTPIEAGACGKPSVVLRWGGFLDTVIEGVTGVFFDQPTATDIADAIERLEAQHFDSKRIQREMERYSEATFGRKLQSAIDETLYQEALACR